MRSFCRLLHVLAFPESAWDQSKTHQPQACQQKGTKLHKLGHTSTDALSDDIGAAKGQPSELGGVSRCQMEGKKAQKLTKFGSHNF
jgi:hypothetical protein